MKKHVTEPQQGTPVIPINQELDKRNLRVSQQKLERMDEVLKKFPPPDLHRRKG